MKKIEFIPGRNTKSLRVNSKKTTCTNPPQKKNIVIFLCSGIPKSDLADLAKITKLYLGELCKLAKWDLDKLCKPLKPIYATYCNSSKLCIPLRLTLLYRHIKLANRTIYLCDIVNFSNTFEKLVSRYIFYAT
jgi:hypothetical protein